MTILVGIEALSCQADQLSFAHSAQYIPKAVTGREGHGLDICPRTCPSALFRCCTYARWFARPSNVQSRSLLDIPVSAACMRGLLRFRMGCHHLPRDEGSWARPQVPRLERICRLCATNALGDEKHLVFECPELECFRQQWSHLFQSPRTMQAFMWQDDNIGIARIINACLRKTREGQTSDQHGVAASYGS